jgi:hypothetical protein
MALPVAAGFLDVVGVVAGPLDDAGVGALAALVQVLAAGDVGGDLAEDAPALVRGKSRVGGVVDSYPWFSVLSTCYRWLPLIE